MMKNDAFVEIAERDGYLDSAEVAEDLKLWEEKWTYEAYRFYLVDDIQISEEELREWFRLHWRELEVADVDSTRFESYRVEVYNEVLHQKWMEILGEELGKLSDRYPVWIDEERLRQLKLTDDEGGKGVSVFLLRRFDNRPAVPVLDLNWLYVN